MDEQSAESEEKMAGLITQKADLESQLKEMEDRLMDEEDAVGDLQSAKKKLEADIDDLRADVEDLEQSLSKVKYMIRYFMSRRAFHFCRPNILWHGEEFSRSAKCCPLNRTKKVYFHSLPCTTVHV